MIPFTRIPSSGSPAAALVAWHGDTCQDVHDFLLADLVTRAAPFVADAANVTEAMRGNLGEYIAFWIGAHHEHSTLELFAPANAFTPLSAISRAGLDLLWARFGESPDDDFLIVQEVKLTGQHDLAYANRLVTDYRKLFGTDLGLTLHTRVQAAKNELEYVKGLGHLVPRLSRLVGGTAATSPSVQLVPTLIHDEDSVGPSGPLLLVRTAIAGLGWDLAQITMWAVALDTLRARVDRLAMGSP